MGLHVSMVPLFTTKCQDSGSSLEFTSAFKTQVGVGSYLSVVIAYISKGNIFRQITSDTIKLTGELCYYPGIYCLGHGESWKLKNKKTVFKGTISSLICIICGINSVAFG